jgi:hypothetical protein
VYPDDLKSYFVDHMLVQHQPDRFVLSFFEVWIPPIMGSEEQQEEHLDKLESVDAKCVARLVVTPEKMRDILRALSDNMDKYEKLVERLARE